jgi:hypothetical protein
VGVHFIYFIIMVHTGNRSEISWVYEKNHSAGERYSMSAYLCLEGQTESIH